MNKTLHAGYILDEVKEKLLNLNDGIDWQDVLRFLSEFTIESTNTCEISTSDPLIAVADNIISRGLPTKPSLLIEENFRNKFQHINRNINKKVGYISYKLIDNTQDEILKRAFLIVDPRLHPRTNQPDRLHFSINTWEQHPGSLHEERFLYEILPDFCGEFSTQLLQPQRKMQSILSFSGRKKDIFDRTLSNVNSFYDQTVDFAIQLPKTKDNKSGFVIEIDGWHHDRARNLAQAILDDERDNICRNIGWFPTERIQTKEINENNIPSSKIDNIKQYLNHPIASYIRSNFENPLFNSSEGLSALQLALTPIAIARIQKTIIELIKCNRLKLDASIWRIAILERDVPCGELAITDFNQLISHLFSLEGINRKLPEIETKVFCSLEFVNCELNSSKNIYDKSIIDHNFRADILLDVSVLQKKGFTKTNEEFIRGFNNPNIEIYEIRSVYAPTEERKISFGAPIEYWNINVKDLKYFIRNIFRKIGFRKGQIEIIERALKGKSVISLLPTGAGKSLTYQLSALLEPGITLVVDPIKSLMKDQDDSLKQLGIDNSVFINSTISSVIEREEKTHKLTEGYYQFIFISPERLQIGHFRDSLREMIDKKTHFSFCVVDEAHCVSEWGHDFRTAYLKVGKNARKYCISGNKQDIPILGLTGTASFDVLSDVQRELDLENEEGAVIRPASLKRDELVFAVKPSVGNVTTGNDIQRKQNVATNKMNVLIDLLNTEIPNKFNLDVLEFHRLNGEKTKSGLVFCPHVDWVFGIKEVQSRLNQSIPSLKNLNGIYAGQIDDDSNINNQKLLDTQDKFKNNELSLLVATKAFGMGIDKENIRYTIHFNMPQSIEAFYQEAGRAGRDRKTSYCYIIYSHERINNGNSVDVDNLMGFYKNSFPGISKEKRILNELLTEIVYPNQTMFPDLSETIENEFGYNLKLSLWPINNPSRLYFNSDEKTSYGYYDFINYFSVPENLPQRMVVGMDATSANKVINNVINFLTGLVPEGFVDLLNWLITKTITPTTLGIQDNLDRIVDNGDVNEILIGFENEKIQLITDYCKSVHARFTKIIVQDACGYCWDTKKFIENLKNEFWKSTNINVNFNNNQINELGRLFNNIRNQQDTFKAIYRLSILGVVDDYEIDYSTKNIKAQIKKLTDQEIIENLKKYIRKYVSERQINSLEFEIENHAGKNTLKKCLGYLVEFAYNNIAKKRIESIHAMENACIIGANGNNANFQEYINTYFDSKYYVPLLEYILDYNISIIWQFIEQVGGIIDELRNLRGACDRLITENPDNALYYLLRAFSKFLLTEGSIEDALHDFHKGLSLFKDTFEMDRAEYTLITSRFVSYVLQNDIRLELLLNNEILKDQLNWLSNYNNLN